MTIKLLKKENVKTIKKVAKNEKQKYFYIYTYGCPLVKARKIYKNEL